MENLLKEIELIQTLLDGSLGSKGTTSLEFLNQLSLKFSKCFDLLHKFLQLIAVESMTSIIEQCLLCANQIVICLKFLEKTIRRESVIGCLITSRQCFYERMQWCLAKLKSTVKLSAGLKNTTPIDQENLISVLDLVLDELAPFSAIDSDGIVTNQAEHRAELMIQSREIRAHVEQLLSHTMTFASIAIESDKIPLKTLAQNIFKAAVEFEEEMSLKPGKKVNENDQKVKAIELENTLLSLENFVNDALLRLVFEVFRAENGKIIGNLRSSSDDELEKEISKFDLFVDRLILIGHCAICFSRDDQRISSTLRSCIASIENIDVYLVPALSKDPSIEVLQEHFEEEVKLMQNNVHEIIDTVAFCTSLIEIIDKSAEECKENFTIETLINLIQRAHVLLHHLQINGKTLKVSEDKVIKFYLGDLKLILSECEAILEFSDIENFEKRAIKRFKILANTIRKLEKAIKILRKVNFDDGDKKEIVKTEKFTSKDSDYFNTIRPSALGSILYESKRSMKFQPRPIKDSLPDSPDDSKIKLNGTSTMKIKNRKNSLRFSIFKKNFVFEGEEAWNKSETNRNLTMDLQITQILDKITDLSTTLSAKPRDF